MTSFPVRFASSNRGLGAGSKGKGSPGLCDAINQVDALRYLSYLSQPMRTPSSTQLPSSRKNQCSRALWLGAIALTVGGSLLSGLPGAHAQDGAKASLSLSDFLPKLPYAPSSDLDLSKRPISDPLWKNASIADIRFSYRGDQRKNRSWSGGRNDFERYEINPEGKIEGAEVLGLARPMERALYDALIGSRIPDAAERAKSYQDYLQRSFDQSVSVLALNRILDHEAMKRLILPRVSIERLTYVKRTALVRFAVEMKKVPTKTVGDDIVSENPRALSSISDEQLYAWMKEGVGNQTLKFKVDWNFQDGGVDVEWEQMTHSGKELPGWPAEMKLSFKKLPDTVEGFEAEIAQQLDAAYRVVIRQNIWRVLVQERKPWIQWETLFAVNVQDEARFYEAMKAREFSVQNLTSSALEWTVSGSAAAAFLAEVEKQTAERERVLTAEIRGAGVPNDPQGIAALREKVKGYRSQEMRTIIEGLLAGDFADEVAAGSLKIAAKPLSFEHDGVSPLPDDDSVASKQKRAAFDQRFSGVLLPRLTATDQAGAQHVMLLVETVAGAPKALPIDHPKVREALRGMLQMRKQGFVFRELAYDLLRENPVNLKVDACLDPRWPCARLDVSRMADVLFPETLLPGESLGTYGPASSVRIPSTLLEPALRDKVMTISLDLLQTVFQVPNDIEVSTYHW